MAKPETLGLYSKESFIIVYHRRHRRRRRQNHDMVASSSVRVGGFGKNDTPRSVRVRLRLLRLTLRRGCRLTSPRLMSTSTHSCPNQQTLVQISSLCRAVVLVITRCDGRNLSTTHEPTISLKHGGRSQTDPEVRAVLLLDLHLLSFGLRLQYYHLGSVG